MKGDLHDLIVFINRRGTAFKVLAGNDYLIYYNHKRKVPLEAIRYLPQFLGGTEFEFSRLVERMIREKLGPDGTHLGARNSVSTANARQ